MRDRRYRCSLCQAVVKAEEIPAHIADHEDRTGLVWEELDDAAAGDPDGYDE
jgi:hypothetical protein